MAKNQRKNGELELRLRLKGILFICVVAITVFFSACNSEVIGLANESPENRNDYVKSVEIFTVPPNSVSCGLQYIPTENMLIYGITGENEKNAVVKIYNDSERVNETVYETDEILLAVMYDAGSIIACIFDGENTISVVKVDSEEKVISAFSVEEAGGYPFKIIKTNENEYALVADYGLYFVCAENDSSHKIKCKNYYIQDCAMLSDGRFAAICKKENGSSYIAEFDSNCKEINNFVETSAPIMFCFASNDELMVTDGYDLYQFDRAENSMTKIFSLMGAGINSYTIVDVVTNGERIIVDTLGAEAKIYMLMPAGEDTSQFISKEKILLYCNPAFADMELISDFNDENPQYEAELMEYQEDSIKSIMSKEIHPDVICEVIPANLENWGDSGYLEDLWPYIDKSSNLSRDDICTSAIEIFSKDGRLYALPQYFNIGGIVINTSLKDFDGDWTVDEFLDWLTRHPKLRCANGVTPYNILQVCFHGIYRDFVDEQQNTARLDSSEFANIIRKISQINVKQECEDGLFFSMIDSKDTEYMYEIGFSSIDDIQELKKFLGNDLTVMGYPGIDSTTLTINPYCSMGIFANSECKDGAYAFCEYYLLAMEKNLDPQSEYSMTSGGLWCVNRLRKNGYELSKRKTKLTVNGIEFEKAGTEADITLAENAIEVAKYEDYIQNQTLYIVLEEFETVLNGTATVEQACNVMQSRVSVLLAERE